MPKHIGIVACSAEGAALCYRTICAEGPAILGPHAHPEITMHTHPLSEYMRILEYDNWPGVADLMASSAQILAIAGADFLICPDNTIHQVFDLAAKASTLPWLHIAEEVAKVATKNHYKRVGVLGTRHLMEGPVYPDKLGAAGIGHKTPEANERKRISEIIFDELVYGKFTDESRAYFSKIIADLKDKGCDSVVLGCTEIPLLISQNDSALPILASTRFLARAALAEARAPAV